jgi:CSLREA domain-containing protein
MRRFLLLLITFLILPTAAHADPTPPGAIVVTSVSDEPDMTPTDDRCDTGDGQCTLRAAIQVANFKPGPDTIAFRQAREADDPHPHRRPPARRQPSAVDPPADPQAPRQEKRSGGRQPPGGNPGARGKG